MTEPSSWVSIIRAVKSPLGIITLIILVGEATFSLVIASGAFGPSDMLVFLAGNFALLGLILVGLFVTFNRNPEVLGGARYEPMTEQLAESLGKDVFGAFDGYLRNETPQVRKAAYDDFETIIMNSSYYSNERTAGFMRTFLQTVLGRVGLGGRVTDVGGVIDKD